jgi:HEAT repeat protein
MTDTPPAPEDRNLTESSAARRRAAVAGHTRDESTARGLLDHDDADVRAAALRALDRMGRVQRDDVERALADVHPTVRRRAIATAIATAIDLTPLLHDRDATVAEQAAWALGEREDPAAVPALLDAARHADALVREAAIAALGAIQDERALPAILAGTEDVPAIRRRAVLALAGYDGPEVDAALARAKDDRDWQVRDAADVILDARGAAPEDGP